MPIILDTSGVEVGEQKTRLAGTDKKHDTLCEKQTKDKNGLGCGSSGRVLA
jgi:hypothetical protein